MAFSENRARKLPLWLIGGPSGVGKSHYSPRMAALKNFLWLEFDTSPRDAVDDLGLRNEWNAFWDGDENPLVAELTRRAAELNLDGVIISLPGNCSLPAPARQALKRAGGLWVMLWATEVRCLNAFLVREKRTGRGLDAAHWTRHNSPLFQGKAAAKLVQVFDPAGKARPAREIVGDIEALP